MEYAELNFTPQQDWCIQKQNGIWEYVMSSIGFNIVEICNHISIGGWEVVTKLGTHRYLIRRNEDARD